jgi:hypothetical protein
MISFSHKYQTGKARLKVSWDAGYGYMALISSLQIAIMLNGYYMSFYKSTHSGKLKFTAWPNTFRKNKQLLKKHEQ